LSADMYELTQQMCLEAGLPAYEISNHARPGDESTHNRIYWRYGEYAGVGPGAHGRILIGDVRHATVTEKMPERWRELAEASGHGLVTNDPLTWEEEGDEYLVMGLRLVEGIEPKRYRQLSGRALDQQRIDELVGYGFVEVLGAERLRVTQKGLPVLDAVVADLAA